MQRIYILKSVEEHKYESLFISIAITLLLVFYYYKKNICKKLKNDD